MPPRGSRSGGNSSYVRPTEMSTLLLGVYGRERRSERQIEKRARRYGMEDPAKKGRLKYTYGRIVFIYDPVKNREITLLIFGQGWEGVWHKICAADNTGQER